MQSLKQISHIHIFIFCDIINTIFSSTFIIVLFLIQSMFLSANYFLTSDWNSTNFLLARFLVDYIIVIFLNWNWRFIGESSDNPNWVSDSSRMFRQTRDKEQHTTGEQFHIWFLTFACCPPPQCTISSHTTLNNWEHCGWRPPRTLVEPNLIRLVMAWLTSLAK